MLKDINKALVMGVLNVTPDSFSDGGLYLSPEVAVRRAEQMIAEGADIVDVGGESTRPGSDAVSEDEELNRVLPVIEKISANLQVQISIDTTRAKVADAALHAGATLLNDVSMLRNGPELAEVAARHNAVLILMHSRKTPKDMQHEISYADVSLDVRDELLKAVSKAMHVGVSSENIWLDPGIGFAKTPEHNLELISKLRTLTDCGYPVLVGPSRKSFIGVYANADTSNRLGGTAAAVAISIFNGATAVRVHDVEVMKQVVTISLKLREAMGNQ